MLKIFALITFGWVSLFALHTAEININQDDLELRGNLDIGQINYSVEPNTTFVGVRLVNGDEAHSDREGAKNGSYVDINFLLKNQTPVRGLSFGLGVKVNYADSFSQDFVSIPLGIEAIYRLPISSSIPIYIGGSIYYAPSVLSLADASDFLEYRLNLDIAVIKNGYITIGYRSMDTDYETIGDYNYNSSGYIGFKFSF
jgi:hypothetical protein